jgi:hypothetical protein
MEEAAQACDGNGRTTGQANPAGATCGGELGISTIQTGPF